MTVQAGRAEASGRRVVLLADLLEDNASAQ
jgi:hypothetical protein